MPGAYVTLNDLVLAPPVSPLLAVLMTCGVLAVARRICRELPTLDPATRPLLSLALAAGILGAFTHAVLWGGLWPMQTFRVVTGVLVAFGTWSLPSLARDFADRIARTWSAASRAERVGDIVLAMSLGLLTLLSVAPACEIDSLNYHLGVPLDWLREGRAFPRYDWMHARLAGLGECLVALGLAGGTDVFLGVLQLSALALGWVALRRLAASPSSRFLAGAVLLSAPVLRVLVFSQKFQLLPALGLLAVAIEVIRGNSAAGLRRPLVLGAVIGIAIASKHTFLLTAAPIVLLYAVLACRGNGMLRREVSGFLVAGAALALPFALRNIAFYGDPIPPFLERFDSAPDSRAVAFATYLRNWGGRESLNAWLALPVTLAKPFRPGFFTPSLGMGLAALPFLVLLRGTGRTLGILSVVLFALHLSVGQLHARMLLDPYLVMAAGVALHEWHRPVLGFLRICAGFQHACTLAMFALVAQEVHPGAWSSERRLEVQQIYVPDFVICEWIRTHSTPDDVILTNLRSKALIPRRFVVSGEVQYGAPLEDERADLARASGISRPTVVILLDQFNSPAAREALEKASGQRATVFAPEYRSTPLQRPPEIRYRIAFAPAIPPAR